MLCFGAIKKGDLLFCVCAFKSEKGPLSHALGRNYLRKFFRHKTIFATFVQIRDEEMKGLCSSIKEGGNCARGLSSPSIPWCVSIVYAKDRSELAK